MTVIKCDVSRNGYEKFGAEFTLVISAVPRRIASTRDIFLTMRATAGNVSSVHEIRISDDPTFSAIFDLGNFLENVVKDRAMI